MEVQILALLLLGTTLALTPNRPPIYPPGCWQNDKYGRCRSLKGYCIETTTAGDNPNCVDIDYHACSYGPACCVCCIQCKPRPMCSRARGRCMSRKSAANGGCDPRYTRPGWCDKRDCVCCLPRQVY